MGDPHGYKKARQRGVTSTHLRRMSIDLSYGNVSPARSPNPGRKRKSTKSVPPAGKKKKEPAIQPRTTKDCDPVVREVVEDTRTAVEEIMKELNDMVEQSTPTPPPQFTLTTVYDNAEDFAQAKADSERKGNAFPLASSVDTEPSVQTPPQFTLMTVYDNTKDFAQAKADSERKGNAFPPSVDTMVCPCHDVRLEARQSQKGWKYVKCPIQPYLLFYGQDQAPDYMKAVYSQPHPEVLDMWSCLQCFCREPATLQQSHSTQNPDRLYVTCSKKKCHFFRWADQPLGPKYWSWFHDHPPKKPTHSPNRLCQAVMLKGIPNVGWTSQALHLE